MGVQPARSLTRHDRIYFEDCSDLGSLVKE